MTNYSKFWQGRSVFVTGATGFLGGWLVGELLKRNAEVVAIVRDGSPRCRFVTEGYVSKISTVHGSIEDLDLIRRTLSEYSVDTIFHLAAQALVGVAKMDPMGTLQANIIGTANVLEAARQSKVQQVVVASSDKAYGCSDRLPYTEDHPLRGTFPYDVSKSCTDLISTMYARTYGLPVAILRCANLFGGGDLNFSRTIPGAIKATLANQRFVIRSDGKFVRDFLYVKDAAEAYLLMAMALSEKPALSGEAFNFGYQERLTVMDVAYQILDLMGHAELEPVIQNQASAEIREQYLDCSKARDVLGWSPKWNMASALKETIEWYRAQLVPALTAEVGAY